MIIKEKFILRPWRETDVDSLVKYANNWNISKNLTDKFPYPYTKENGHGFIKIATSHLPTSIFCIEINNEAAGGIGLHFQSDIYRKNAELGYWLAEPYWGQGIMTEVIQEVVQYGFTQFQINRIFARPFGTNTASQRVLEKAGFRLEAKFEKTLIKNEILIDEWVYGIRRDPLSTTAASS